jgi:hypothetical protein
MNEDIYNPPLADIDIDIDSKGSPVKAIIVATLVDIVGTIIAAIAFNIAYSIVLASRGLTAEEIAANIQNADTFSFYAMAGYVFGSMMTILAGYLCARIANYSEYKFVGIYCAIVILFGTVMGWNSLSTAEQFLLPVLSIVSAFFGAWLHVRSKNGTAA